MEKLQQYIPLDRRQALANQTEIPLNTTGSIMVADIARSTIISENFIKDYGLKEGAEEFTKLLNTVFEILCRIVHEYNGVVLCFNGDAITCFFNDDEGNHALKCAVSMREMILPLKKLTTTRGTPVNLDIKISIAHGEVKRFLVGDPDIQLFDVVAGTPLNEFSEIEQTLKSGEIGISNKLYRRYEDKIKLDKLQQLPSGSEYAVIKEFLDSPSPVKVETNFDIPEESIRTWILPPVYQTLCNTDESFLCQLRSAVVFFINLVGIDYDEDDNAVTKFDYYIRQIQRILSQYGGYLLQIIIGDKGSYCYGAFGAPIAHENDPEQAIAAAVEIIEATSTYSIKDVKIGISMDRMYTGTYGGKNRKTYGAIAKSVNIAARLMEFAGSGEIFITDKIYKRISGYYVCENLGKKFIRGVLEPIDIYQVRSRKSMYEGLIPSGTSKYPMFGREQEKEFLTKKLESLGQTESCCVVIEGEAGIGKSRLISDFISQIKRKKIEFIYNEAVLSEQNTPFFIFRSIIQKLFRISKIPNPQLAKELILSQVDSDQFIKERLPLLNELLPLSFKDTDLTSRLGGEVRLDNIKDLIIALIKNILEPGKNKLVFIIEDTHWIDSASWKVIREIKNKLPACLLVLTSRPLQTNYHKDLPPLLEEEKTFHIKMNRLEEETVKEMIRYRLDVTHIPHEVYDFINEKADGNPFFVEEITLALKESPLLAIEGNTCRLRKKGEKLDEVDFPSSIEEIITSRIDKLPVDQQTILKIASVIGRAFNYRILKDLYGDIQSNELMEMLFNLVRLNMTTLENAEPHLVYIFRHVITQEVAYNMLLYSQRRELHERIARWYEEKYKNQLDSYFPLLAFHYFRAEDYEKSLEFYTNAGENALNNYANEEAVEFFTRILEICDRNPQNYDPVTRAEWEIKLGIAYVNWSKYQEGKPYLERGMGRLGFTVAKNKPKQVLNLIGQIILQRKHRKNPVKYIGKGSADSRKLLIASRMFEKMTEVYYFEQQVPNSLFAAFCSLNTAESAGGKTEELARAYSTIGVLLGFIPLHKLAQTYFDLSLEVLEDVNNLSAKAWIFLIMGFYYTGLGKFAKAKDFYEQASSIVIYLGDQRVYNDIYANLIVIKLMEGHFSIVTTMASSLYQSASGRSDIRYMVRGLGLQAAGYLHQGNYHDCRDCLTRLDEYLESVTHKPLKITISGDNALLYLRMKKYDKAFESIMKTFELTQATRPSYYGAYTGYAAPAEVFLTLWDQGYEHKDLKVLAKKALKNLKKYAKIFAIGTARYQMWLGLYSFLKGSAKKARHHWESCLTEADSRGLAYDRAHCLFLMATHLPLNEHEKKSNLQEACRIFKSSCANSMLEQVYKELGRRDCCDE